MFKHLKPFIKRKGISFCRWPDENKKMTEAKLHTKALPKEHELLEALEHLQGNLSFKKKDIEVMLDLALEEFNSVWTLNEADKKDWRATLRNRIRNMCRVIQQGVLKHKKKPAK